MCSSPLLRLFVYPRVSSGFFRSGKTTLDEEMVVCEGKVFQPAPWSSNFLRMLIRWGFFPFHLFFSPIIHVQEHTGDSSLVHTDSLLWDLLFCKKNMSLLQKDVESGVIKARVHPGTDPHSGTCSRSFSTLPCAALVS